MSLRPAPAAAAQPLDIVILGLAITSSWGNGHATTYRALTKALTRQGHSVLFLERDVPWYAQHRDALPPTLGRVQLYRTLEELGERFREPIERADAVIVGSYVPDGADVLATVLRIARGVVAFYDIDTPVTMAALAHGEAAYVRPAQLSSLDLYLSFTGGPLLEALAARYQVRSTAPLYCAVDPEVHFPDAEAAAAPRWAMGYLGTWSADRQPALRRLLTTTARLRPAQRFVVAGAQYPEGLRWPANVERIEHLPPAAHRRFYSAQRFTLNLTRADMIAAGWSPSVRLFEAAACGVPIISDAWSGLDTFFRPEEEIVIAGTARDVLRALAMPEGARRAMAAAARAAILARHTADARAEQLAALLRTALVQRAAAGSTARGAEGGYRRCPAAAYDA